MKKTSLLNAIRLGMFLIACFVIETSANAQDGNSNNPQASGQMPRNTPERIKDYQDTPRVLYETDPPAQGARKNRTYAGPGAVPPPDKAGGFELIEFDEHHIVDIPVQESNIILIGTVTDSKAYLVNNKTGVYSEYTFLTGSVLKNNTSQTLTPGSIIDGTRDGGIVQYLSGKSNRYRTAGKGSLELKGKYIVFLKQIDEGDFEILTGYLLKNGVVTPLDGARLYLSGETIYDKHANQNIQTFLDEVLTAIHKN